MDRITLMRTDLARRLRAIWEAQNRTARMVTIGVIAVVVIGIAALSTLYVGHKPSYDVLFAGLSADDAVAVTQRLKDDKIGYHTQQVGNSTTIYVASSVFAEERVQVAGSGILQNGGTGYELFDKTNFGMTGFQEAIAKTRAIELLRCGNFGGVSLPAIPVSTAPCRNVSLVARDSVGIEPKRHRKFPYRSSFDSGD